MLLIIEHSMLLIMTSYFHRPKPTTVVMLIDTSVSGNHGNKLYQSMIYHQEKPPTLLIKRLLLSSVFHSLARENEDQQHQQLDISKADINICVSWNMYMYSVNTIHVQYIRCTCTSH